MRLKLIWNEQKTPRFAVRFVNLMQMGDNPKYFQIYYLLIKVTCDQLFATGGGGQKKHMLRMHGARREEYIHQDYHGFIGVIASYFKDFCKGCNSLHVCFNWRFSILLNSAIMAFHYDPLLQSKEQKLQLKQFFYDQLTCK